MNNMHETNQKHWDAASPDWERLRDNDGGWRRCPQEPSLAFEGTALDMIREFVGELRGKSVCVIGSGDNYASFALAGLGATVTLADISEKQLAVAAKRASKLGLDILFVRSDAVDLSQLPAAGFDMVCSTNGFFVWIADLVGVFAAVSRVLRPGGYYIFYDVHPFMRPWENRTAIEMKKPYFETGPFQSGSPDDPNYEFHWTIGDILNAPLKAGMEVRRIAESPARDSRFWQGSSYEHRTDESVLDWHDNPRAGLPVWLTVAAKKPRV